MKMLGCTSRRKTGGAALSLVISMGYVNLLKKISSLSIKKGATCINHYKHNYTAYM